MRAATASHVPSRSASFEALESEPLTCSARSSAVVTVALGITVLISSLTAAMFSALSASHVDLADAVSSSASACARARGR